MFKKAALILLTVSIAAFAANSSSEKFSYMKNDLSKLAQLSSSNTDLNELLETANLIGEMNDRCGSISLTEPLDESCQTFYKVTLPEFEKKYSQVTGSIRIGSMQLKDGAQHRIANINACVDALTPFYVSHSSVLELDGDIVDVIPLDEMGERINVKYDFELRLSKLAIKSLLKMADSWLSQCGSAIVDKSSGEYVPMFSKKVEALNKQMAAVSPVQIEAKVVNSNIGGGHKAIEMVFAFKSKNVGYYRFGKEKLFTAQNESSYGIVFLGMYMDYLGYAKQDGLKLVSSVDFGCVSDGNEKPYGCGAMSSTFRRTQNQKFRGDKKTLTSKGVDGTWIWY